MFETLQDLAKQSIYIGTSSWKYEGWKGLVYRRPYTSETTFKNNCLTEYANHFPVVGVDHTYYAVPSEQTMRTYFLSTPDPFRFVLKAPDSVTLQRFPNIPRYKLKSRQINELFLDSSYFLKTFLPSISLLGPKLAGVIFEFSQFKRGSLESGSEFVKRLSFFLASIRLECQFPIGIEIRNRGWLVPQYFEVLEKFNVSPVLNSWTFMPPITEQLHLVNSYTFPSVFVRLLLKPGRSYQQAVNLFYPYTKIHTEEIETRLAVARLINISIKKKSPCYILVNNRFEGCAPLTIKGILDSL